MNDDEAAVVVRIFKLFAAGQGITAIAHELNRDGIAGPSGGTRWQTARRGWAPTTIGEFLRAERYIGRFVWNKSQWFRASNGKRLRRMRPENEWRVREEPSLAIVPIELWGQVQARLRPSRPSSVGGRPPGTGKRPHLLSGWLRCGTCAGTIGVVGTKVKNRTTYSTYGCSNHKNRGETICDNALTVSELKAKEGLLGSIRDLLLEPALVDQVVRAFTARLQELESADATDGDRRQLEKSITEQEKRVANLLDMAESHGHSESLSRRLQDAESKLQTLHVQRKALAKPTPAAKLRPHPAVVRRYLDDFVVAARELLIKHVGTVTLTPKTENAGRYYLATGAFDLSVALTAASGGVPPEVCGNSGSGGRI